MRVVLPIISVHGMSVIHRSVEMGLEPEMQVLERHPIKILTKKTLQMQRQ